MDLGISYDAEMLVIYGGGALVIVLFWIIIWWRIFGKAGFGGGWGILMAIPIINLLPLLVLSFAPWPSLQEKTPSEPYERRRIPPS